MRGVAIMATGILGLTVLAGCGGPSRAAAGLSSSHAQQAGMAPCHAPDLSWRPGVRVVPMTGEHAELFYLANRGSAACTVRGYPRALLYDAGGSALPFRYADGGGPYVTARKPAAVRLKPGASAYVVIAQYRCDLRIKANAVSVRLTLPLGGGAMVSHRLRLPVTGPPGLSYCSGGRRDPGQLITISPLEPSYRATVAVAARQR